MVDGESVTDERNLENGVTRLQTIQESRLVDQGVPRYINIENEIAPNGSHKFKIPKRETTSMSWAKGTAQRPGCALAA